MTNLGTLSYQASDRVRDPNFNATSQTNVIGLLSYAQQVVNGALDDVTGSASLILQPRTTIYQLSTFLPNAVRVQGVRDASLRDLDSISYENLQQMKMRWLTSVSDAPRNWCQCGRDLLIVYPGVSRQQTLTVIYTALTPVVAGIGDTTVVPDEDDDAALDLAELLLLIQHRDLTPFKDAIQRFEMHMKELKDERR